MARQVDAHVYDILRDERVGVDLQYRTLKYVYIDFTFPCEARKKAGIGSYVQRLRAILIEIYRACILGPLCNIIKKSR